MGFALYRKWGSTQIDWEGQNTMQDVNIIFMFSSSKFFLNFKFQLWALFESTQLFIYLFPLDI